MIIAFKKKLLKTQIIIGDELYVSFHTLLYLFIIIEKNCVYKKMKKKSWLIGLRICVN